MSEELVTYELEGDIALVCLNRPEKRNAFNPDVATALAHAVIRANEEAKIGIIYGKGDHFCAGLDLEHFRNRMSKGDAKARRRSQILGPGGARGFDLIARGDIPWVSALHGAVIGGGFEMAASTHIRVADTTAFFALPEGQRGIYTGAGASVRVSRLISVARMTDLMLTGRVMKADEAERCNAVQYVVEKGKHLEKAKELALVIASNRQESNFAVINALPRIADLSYNDGLYVEGMVATGIYSEESTKRLTDFLDGKARRLKPSEE